MIKSENYGGGVRWYCDRCDELYDSNGRLTIHYTNSKPPANCSRCDEPAVMVCWHGGRPSFVSMVMTRAEAAQLQRIMHEGGVYDVETGRRLKDQMVNRGR
jgi:hypothetical protein